MAHNTLTSSCENDWSTRVSNFTPIVQDINPDIIIQIELNGSSDIPNFLNAINNSSTGPYTAGTYQTCSCSDRNYYYYKANEFDDLGNISIPSGGGNNFNLFKLYHKTTQDTIFIFAVHLNPSLSGATTRTTQINNLKSYILANLVDNANYLVVGDFNIFSPNEQAYQNLVDQSDSNIPYVFDPINDPPSFIETKWSDNLNKYGDFLSISTRYTGSSCVNTGGSNVRVDMILYSNAIKNDLNYIEYDSGSFKVYGQDGNHFNRAITDTPSVSNAQYLYAGSDHFPVYADFVFKNNNLPVELSSFSGKKDKDGIVLEWRTETEVNNYRFEIQRSQDKVTWDKVGFVPGSGNSNSPKNYSFTDKPYFSGKIYYRLKQIDIDGKFEYSAIIEINYNFSKEASLYQNYPNPFNPVSTIEYFIPNEGFVSLKVFDVLGREVATIVNEKQDVGKHSVIFDGTGFTSGIYFYILRTENKVLTKKMSLLK